MLIGAIPLASLNRHTPICCDTRLAKAASSLDAPTVMRAQNACLVSRWLTSGRAGKCIGARPVRAVTQPFGRPVQHILSYDVAITAGNHRIYQQGMDALKVAGVPISTDATGRWVGNVCDQD